MTDRGYWRRILFVVLLLATANACDSRKKSRKQQDLNSVSLAHAVHNHKLVLDSRRSQIVLTGYASKLGIWKGTMPVSQAEFTPHGQSLRLIWNADLREANIPATAITKALNKVLDRSIAVQWRIGGAIKNVAFPALFPDKVTHFASDRAIWMMFYGTQSRHNIILDVKAEAKDVIVRSHGNINLSMNDLGMQHLMDAMVRYGAGKPSPLLSIRFNLVFVPAPRT